MPSVVHRDLCPAYCQLVDFGRISVDVALAASKRDGRLSRRENSALIIETKRGARGVALGYLASNRLVIPEKRHAGLLAPCCESDNVELA
jgi:hypothetical protein